MSKASEWADARKDADEKWRAALSARPEWSTWGVSITTEDDGRPTVRAERGVTLDAETLCEAAHWILDTFGDEVAK